MLLAIVLALTPLLPTKAAGYLPNYEGLEPREREMFKAVSNSDSDQVEAVLKQGADVNARDGRGENVLLHAAIRSDIATMKVLLQARASVDQATSWGRTALIAAAEDSAMDAVSLLLDSQADVNAALDDGTTALMVAARFSDVRLVRVLLEKGADPNARATDGLYPLLIAAGRGNAEMMKLLKAKGAVADDELRSGIEHIEKKWSAKTIEVVDAIFREAVQNWSTAPSLVLVTVVDSRAQQRRDVCVEVPSLLAALEKENRIRKAWTVGGHTTLKVLALAQEGRVFEFKHKKALRFIEPGYTARDVERFREALRTRSDQNLYRSLTEDGLQEIGPALLPVVRGDDGAERPNDAVVAHVLIERGFPMARGDVGPRLFFKDEDYGPILLDAARRGDAQLVEEVLSRRVQISPRTATGASAAEVATASGHTKIAERLKRIGVNSEVIED